MKNMEHIFDTHAVVQKLKRAGLSELQAEEFVNALLDSQLDLVTKQFLKTELLDLENRLLIKIGAMQIALGAFLASIKIWA
jgi:hypothetical protein